MPTAEAASSHSSILLPGRSDPKRALRQWARAARDAASAQAGEAAALAARDVALTVVGPPPSEHAIVAGYWPIGGELDCRPLLDCLAGIGWACALPVATAAAAPLLFRRWRSGDELVVGRHGVREPRECAEAVTPAVALVPLLAFDRAGHRLGYGAGYYDRTLEGLRARGPVRAIGLAFAAQELPELPAEPHDQRLDWIVTERGAIRIHPS